METDRVEEDLATLLEQSAEIIEKVNELTKKLAETQHEVIRAVKEQR